MELKNPYTPSAGIMPPYLAGREKQKNEFLFLLDQEMILKNATIMGLRGVGKTVFLDSLRGPSITKGWLWCGTLFSESAAASEETMVIRILADLAIVTSNVVVHREQLPGFQQETREHALTFSVMKSIYENTPGLTFDKLKAVLEMVWEAIRETRHGIVFAYDEAQLMADHAKKEQYPLSVILDVFQSLQRKQIRFLLVLSGLPTLTSRLVEARTYTERMFQTILLGKLSESQSREAILKPLETLPVKFADHAVTEIIHRSGGYPYFIQFICKEAFDVYISQTQTAANRAIRIPYDEIISKLDKDFFASRWTKATDRQKELLKIIASLDSPDGEFTIQEIVTASAKTENPFGTSQANQMLSVLINAGMIYKEAHGKYRFAVPLLAEFIKRQ